MVRCAAGPSAPKVNWTLLRLFPGVKKRGLPYWLTSSSGIVVADLLGMVDYYDLDYRNIKKSCVRSWVDLFLFFSQSCLHLTLAIHYNHVFKCNYRRINSVDLIIAKRDIVSTVFVRLNIAMSKQLMIGALHFWKTHLQFLQHFRSTH